MDIKQTKKKLGDGAVFPIGAKNEAAKYLTGQNYLSMLSKEMVVLANVTFEPGSRNWWHTHNKNGQILLVTGGRGYYQAKGEEPVELKPGDVIHIPIEVPHWHGAAPDSWFSYIVVELPGEIASNEWHGPVTNEEYSKLK